MKIVTKIVTSVDNIIAAVQVVVGQFLHIFSIISKNNNLIAPRLKTRLGLNYCKLRY